MFLVIRLHFSKHIGVILKKIVNLPITLTFTEIMIFSLGMTSNNRLDLVDIDTTGNDDDRAFHMLQTWRREESGKAEQLVAALHQMARGELALILHPVVAPPTVDQLASGCRVDVSRSGLNFISGLPPLPVIASV